ncbi:MAG: hypothetical protein WEC59_10760 [Salibacteraceae bacterium]
MLARIYITILLIVTYAFTLQAEDDNNLSLKAKIKQLVELRMVVLSAETDEAREEANKKFLVFMRDALNHPESFNASFDTIPNIGDLRSGDGFFRMVNWNLPYENLTNRYFCFVQYKDKKSDEYKLIELKTGYRGLSGEYRKIFNEKDWYGALYYDIVPSKTRGKNRKRAYMLLGWQGKDEYSSLKVIDVLQITKRGLRFGADIFDYPYERNIKRFILEYKSDAAVSLKYDNREKRIVFNQLVPMQPDLEGMHEFYIPVLEFNAFVWKRRKWIYEEDVEVKMKRKKEDVYNFPPEEQNLR